MLLDNNPVQVGDKKALTRHLDRCGPSMAKALLASAEVMEALKKAERGSAVEAASGLRSIASQEGFAPRVSSPPAWPLHESL